MNALFADLNKTATKHAALEQSELVIDSIIKELEVAQSRIASGSDNLASSLPALLQLAQVGNAKLTDAIKEVHNPLNKLGKGIEKVRRLPSVVLLYD